MSKSALLFLTSLLLSTSALFVPGAAQAQRPITWAQVIKLVNKVQFKPTNANWRQAQSADRLQQSGEALFTSRGGRADLRLSEGSLLRMSSNTHLWIQPNSRNLLQRSGTALYVIRPGGGQTLISTPYGRAGVRGSALFVRVNEETGTMIVGALTNNPAGPMEVTTEKGPKQTLEAGQMAVVRDGQISMFEFDLKTFYQTSSLTQGFALDGKAGTSDDGTLADPEIQQTLQAVKAETTLALSEQKPVVGSDVAVNPGFLNSSSRNLKPADLIMQYTAGGFDPNSSQTAAGIAAARQGLDLPDSLPATILPPSVPPIPPVPIVPVVPEIVPAIVPEIVPAIVPVAPPRSVQAPPAPTTGVNPVPVVATPTVPERTIPAPPTTPAIPTPPTTPAIPKTPAIPAVPATPGIPAIPATPAVPNPSIGQPNNPQLPVIQPILQPIEQPLPERSVGLPSSPPVPTPVEPIPTPTQPMPKVEPPRIEIEIRIEQVVPAPTPTRIEPVPTPTVTQPITPIPTPTIAPVQTPIPVPTPAIVPAPVFIAPIATPAVVPTITPIPTPTIAPVLTPIPVPTPAVTAPALLSPNSMLTTP